MLPAAIADETFQFGCGGGPYIFEAMCAVQHIEFA